MPTAPSQEQRPTHVRETPAVERVLGSFSSAVRERAVGVVALEGATGSGRSTLLSTVRDTLRRDEVQLLCARTDEGGFPSFWPELVQAALAHARPLVSRARLEALEARLAPLRGRLGRRDPGVLAEAFLELLSISSERPVALLVDDVDRADPSSLQVLCSVIWSLAIPPAARGPDRCSAGGVMVLACREGMRPAALSELFARLAVTRVELPPLDLAGVQRLLSKEDVARRLLEASEGIPSRLEAILSSRPADLIARRIERLSSEEKEVLGALAVLARPADEALLEVILARRAGDDLTLLRSERFLEALPGAGCTLHRFAREVDREAVLARLDPERRRRLHAAAGAALERRSDPAGASGHFAAAGESRRALELALEAVDGLALELRGEAVPPVLLPLLDLPLSEDDRAAIHRQLGEAAQRAGRTIEAMAHFGRARRGSGARERAQLRARCARLCTTLGRAAAAERLSQRVLDDSSSPATARSEALAALVEARFIRGAYLEVLERVGSFAQLEPVDRAVAENARGKALLALGRLEEAADVFAANARRAQDAGLHDEHARALVNAGVVAHRLGRREEARRAYREALTAGHTPLVPVAHANLASLSFEEGLAGDALVHGHRAVEAFALSGRMREHALALQNLARTFLYLGELDRAGALAKHASELGSRLGDPYVSSGASLVEAEVSFVAGEPGAAERIAAAAESFETIGSLRYAGEARLLDAAAWLEQMQAEKAGQALEAALRSGVVERPETVADYQLLLAERELLREDGPAAASALAEARRALIDRPHLEWPVRLHHLGARLAALEGEQERERSEQLRAAALVDELASKLPAERRLAFLGRRDRRAVLEAAGRAVLVPRPVRAEVPRPSRGALVGQAPSIGRINALVDRLGRSNATVLIRGESGTGKELVARALHARSPRAHLPMVVVNCGALTEELLLSELFGHEKGAFTGAVREHRGRFELAEGGTIFLDEIGDVSPRAQVALLRVLQERTFERVGGTRTLRADVRVICATHRPLETMIAEGRFREDLYYRLRVATLTLPSLRDRDEDVELLATHLLEEISLRDGSGPWTLSREALALLRRHRWPGNVRELVNALEGAVLMSESLHLGPEAFELHEELFSGAPPTGQGRGPAAPVNWYDDLRQRGLSLRDLRSELESACIAGALREGGGVVSEAARLLGVKRSRLSQVIHEDPRLQGLLRGSDGGADEPVGARLADESGE